MKSKILWLSVLVVVVLITWYMLVDTRLSPFVHIQPSPTTTIATTSTDQTQQTSDASKDTFTENPDGSNLYKNIEYGFSFNVPKGWHLVGTDINLGTIQLFNYDTHMTRGSVFSSNENKIEISIGTGSLDEIVSKIKTLDPTADYPINAYQNTRIVVAGNPAIKTESELVGGEKERTYRVSLAPHKNRILSMTIYGDSANFSYLDKLVQSLKF